MLYDQSEYSWRLQHARKIRYPRFVAKRKSSSLSLKQSMVILRKLNSRIGASTLRVLVWLILQKAHVVQRRISLGMVHRADHVAASRPVVPLPLAPAPHKMPLQQTVVLVILIGTVPVQWYFVKEPVRIYTNSHLQRLLGQTNIHYLYHSMCYLQTFSYV